MDKYIGFDIDSKKKVACVVQKGEKDRYTTFTTDNRDTGTVDYLKNKTPFIVR